MYKDSGSPTLPSLIMETTKKRKVAEGEAVAIHSPIADPIADDSLARKLIKLATKCTLHTVSEEKMCRRGVKEVVKSLRKGKRGLVILAADIMPVELVAHIPIMCEDRTIPYIYVESKEFLGQAALSKRATTVLMLARPPSGHDLRDKYKALFEEVLAKNPYMK